MPQSQDPLDLLVAAVPSLRSWREQADDYRDVPHVHYSLLAEELVQQAQERIVPTLSRIAPVIERLLQDFDEHDQVSIGFIEKFQALVEERGLDSNHIYQTLGPIARQQWESLYHYRHQLHLCQIDFDQRHIANWVGGPARFEGWLVKAGARVPKGTALARMSVVHQTYELQVGFGCYIDRFAAARGQDLPEGSLLLYVLPGTDAHIKPQAPYCTLRLVGPRPDAAA